MEHKGIVVLILLSASTSVAAKNFLIRERRDTSNSEPRCKFGYREDAGYQCCVDLNTHTSLCLAAIPLSLTTAAQKQGFRLVVPVGSDTAFRVDVTALEPREHCNAGNTICLTLSNTSITLDEETACIVADFNLSSGFSDVINFGCFPPPKPDFVDPSTLPIRCTFIAQGGGYKCDFDAGSTPLWLRAAQLADTVFPQTKGFSLEVHSAVGQLSKIEVKAARNDVICGSHGVCMQVMNVSVTPGDISACVVGIFNTSYLVGAVNFGCFPHKTPTLPSVTTTTTTGTSTVHKVLSTTTTQSTATTTVVGNGDDTSGSLGNRCTTSVAVTSLIIGLFLYQ